MKESFVFYKSFYEAISDLREKDKLKLFEAICELALNDNEIELKGIASTIFKLIKPQIVANNERYNNGKKGGRPKKEKTIGFENGKTIGFENKKPNVNVNVNVNENVNVNDNENDNDNVNVNDNDNVIKEKNKKEKLFEFVEKSFGRTLSSSEYEFIQKWEDNELTRYAIKQAELARAFSVKYIDKILFNFQKENIKTVAEAEAQDKKFRENKTKNTYKTPYEKSMENIQKFREEMKAKEEAKVREKDELRTNE